MRAASQNRPQREDIGEHDYSRSSRACRHENPCEAGSTSNVTKFRANDAVLRSKVGQYPELRLADWNSVSARLQSSWFSADSVHLGGSAASAMADLIGDSLDARPTVSNVNVAPGTITADLAIVTSDGTRDVCLFSLCLPTSSSTSRRKGSRQVRVHARLVRAV